MVFAEEDDWDTEKLVLVVVHCVSAMLHLDRRFLEMVINVLKRRVRCFNHLFCHWN